MNTTMADGAHDRLVAQIGESLFDQPGMTLTEQANRVRELRGNGPALLGPREGVQDERARFEAWAQAQSHRGGNIPTARDAGHPDVYAAPLAQLTWKSWQAAISAQPSPGGQGDALPPLPRMEHIGRVVGNGPYDTWYEPVAYTAKQMLDYARTALAARQPVGQEPVAWLVHWSDMPMESPEVTRSASRISEVSALTNPPRIVPLYTTPPGGAE